MIVARDHDTRLTFAHLLMGKSTVNEEYAEEVLKFIHDGLKYLNYNKLILKCEQENSITVLRERVRQVRAAIGAQTIPEDAPKGESQFNGVVEKAVQEVEDMVAALLLHLESRAHGQSPLEATFFCLFEYAATLVNYFRE